MTGTREYRSIRTRLSSKSTARHSCAGPRSAQTRTLATTMRWATVHADDSTRCATSAAGRPHPSEPFAADANHTEACLHLSVHHRYVTGMPKFIQILPWLTLIHVRDLRPARSLHHAFRAAGVNHARTSFLLSARHQCGRDATFPSNSAILSISYAHAISGHRFPGSVSV